MRIKKLGSYIVTTATLSTIYAFCFTITLVWGLWFIYSLLISFATSLTLGMLSKDNKVSFVCSFISLIIGAMMATFIMVRPTLVVEPWKTDIVLTVTLSSVAKLLLPLLALNFTGIFIGVLFGQSFEE